MWSPLLFGGEVNKANHYDTTEGIRSIVNQKISYGSEQESQDLI
jgi:hypothetical protein